MELGEAPAPFNLGSVLPHRQAGQILVQALAQFIGVGLAVGAGLGEEHPVTA